MLNHSIDDVRTMMADLAGEPEVDGAIAIIESYDPTKEAVVSAAVGDGNPVWVKMRLDAPYIDDLKAGEL